MTNFSGANFCARRIFALCSGLSLVSILPLVASPVRAETEFSAVYQRIVPSVAYIVSALPTGAASGSGFIYKSDATTTQVVTANHIVEGATAIDVILDSDTAKRYKATVIAHDHTSDVALLQISVGGRKPISMLEQGKIVEGSDVAVIGYPRVARFFQRIENDDLRPSVHRGILSAIRLNGRILQFDAATDHGDSGGPVIDVKSGEVIGIVKQYVPDPNNRDLGVDKPLPGSSLATSSLVIQSVIAGSPLRAVTTVAATAQGTSAQYRVGFGAPEYQNSQVQFLSQSVTDRLVEHFKERNAFYVVPVKFGISEQQSAVVEGACDDLRLNALMEPLIRWNSKGQNIPGVYDSRVVEVWVDFKVTDCSGGLFFFVEKTKWERTLYANRSQEREVLDMSNDMLDQALKAFEAFEAEHIGAWDSLLKTGIGIDPKDDHYHAMFHPSPDKKGFWRVYSVFPGGPADKAGVQRDDVIESVDGKALSGIKYDDALGLFNRSSYQLVLRRPGGNVTVQVEPKKYSDLRVMLKR